MARARKTTDKPAKSKRRAVKVVDDRRIDSFKILAPMTGSRARIEIPSELIADFCRRNHIRRLALFGSVLRDDFTPGSDVDVLVEFEPGKTPGFAFVRLQDELSDLLGRRADLRTPSELSKYFRDEVLAEAEEVYVETR